MGRLHKKWNITYLWKEKKVKKQKNILVYTFLFFLIGVITFSDKISTSKIFYFTSVVYAIACVFYIFKRRNAIRFNFCLLLNLGFVFFLLLSILWQKTDLYYSTRLSTEILIFIFCFLTVQWIISLDDIHRAFHCIVFANVFNCIYRLCTGGIQEVLGHLKSQVPLIVGANDVAVALVLTFALTIYLFRLERKKIYILYAGLFLAVGFMTASRKAIIGFALVIIIQYVFKDNHLLKNLIVTCCVLAVVFLIFNKVPVFAYANERLQQLADFSSGMTENDSSSTIRQHMIEVGLAAFKRRPLLGYGVGYSYQYLVGTYLHNNYVEIGVSLGSIGLLLFYFPHILILCKTGKVLFNRNVCITILTLVLSLLLMDFGAVTYFNKFVFIMLNILYVFEKCGIKEK